MFRNLVNRFAQPVAVAAGTVVVAASLIGSALAADKPAAKGRPAPAAAPTAAAPAAAAPEAAAPAKISGPAKELMGIMPAAELKAGNAPVTEVKKKRGDSPTVAPSKEAIVAWFTALNIKHTVDEQGRIIVPFREEASGVNFNILLIPRVKPATSAVWAIQGVVPLALPLPAGDSGLARALIFSNNWNNDHFLNKVSLMQPGEKPFFLLDATLVCEGGLNQANFFNNFLVLLVQDGLAFAKKGLAELK